MRQKTPTSKDTSAANASRRLDDWLGLLSRSLSALGDQRAEILPVQRPRTLVVGAHCMMRLARILMFPCFFLASRMGCPLNRGAFQNAQTPTNAIF
jgi:hypothetical protein